MWKQELSEAHITLDFLEYSKFDEVVAVHEKLLEFHKMLL